MIHKLLEIAEREVGVRESGGNNNGRRIREYQSATDLQPAAWPWCAAWVDWCIREWLKDEEAVRWLNLKVMTPEAWRPKTALAYGFYEWSKARPKTTLLLSETAEVQPGDIVMFDFSHVGIVVREHKPTGTFESIEGNTNVAGSRDSVSGDGVWRKVRNKRIARNFIRLRAAE
jgi:hypothetical protein